MEIQFPAGTKIIRDSGERRRLSESEIREKIQNNSELVESVKTKRTLLIINDAHRATPSYQATEALLSVQNHRIEALIIATGTHKIPTKQELERLVRGKARELKLFIHDAHLKEEKYLNCGLTRRETEVLVNPILKQFQNIVCINSVEPHYFAGFTGGMKSIIPGLAAQKTVTQNHSWALDPRSGPGITDTNPLFLDLWDAFDLVKLENVYGIQFVLEGNEVLDLTTGQLKEAHQKAIQKSKELSVHSLEQEVDTLISVVKPPLNRSLYQAQKGLENTRQVVKEGGKIILVAECSEGIGNQAFYQTLISFSSAKEVIANLKRESYNFGDHKAHKLATLSQKVQLFCVSQLTKEECNNMYMKKITDEQLERIIREDINAGKNVVVLLDSGMKVLTLIPKNKR